jgi:hypothetical protein
MSDIFISYAREDQPVAQMFAQALGARGWSIFWDRTIPIGKTWHDTIGSELENARCVIVLWSKTSIRSEWVRDEADEGKQRGILVPVLIEKILPPLGYRSFQAADLVNWDGKEPTREFNALVTGIARLLGPPPNEAEEARQPAPARPVRDRIFISYAREDEGWRALLNKALRQAAGELKIWVADMLSGTGAQWRQQIEQELASTKTAVVLVSPAFIVSKLENELPPLLEEAAKGDCRILWINVAPVPDRMLGRSVIPRSQASLYPGPPLAELPKTALPDTLKKIASVILDIHQDRASLASTTD